MNTCAHAHNPLQHGLRPLHGEMLLGPCSAMHSALVGIWFLLPKLPAHPPTAAPAPASCTQAAPISLNFALSAGMQSPREVKRKKKGGKKKKKSISRKAAFISKWLFSRLEIGFDPGETITGSSLLALLLGLLRAQAEGNFY